MAFTKVLGWLRNGESGTGSTQAPPARDGVLNRPLGELLDNDLFLLDLQKKISGVEEVRQINSSMSPVTLSENILYELTCDGAIELRTPAKPTMVDGMTFRIKMVGGNISANPVVLKANGQDSGTNIEVHDASSVTLTKDFFDYNYSYSKVNKNWVPTSTSIDDGEPSKNTAWSSLRTQEEILALVIALG